MTNCPIHPSRAEMIDWLVRWRVKYGGSVSETNHRKYLSRMTSAELSKRIAQIEEAMKRLHEKGWC